MTIQEIIISEKAYLTATDISPVLNCDPQCIRIQAQQNPEMLGFPVIVIGRRIRIPRLSFLRFMGVI